MAFRPYTHTCTRCECQIKMWCLGWNQPDARWPKASRFHCS